MPMIKICVVTSEYDPYDDYSTAVLREGISDWEEVTSEELALIRAYLPQLRQPSNRRLVIVEQDGVSITTRIESIRKLVEDARKRDEEEKERRAEAQRKRDATKAKRALKQQAKTEEEERTLLEVLQQKYKK